MATIPHALRQPNRPHLRCPLGNSPGIPGRSLYATSAPPEQSDEPPPCEPEPWQAVAPVRPDTAHVRAPRFLDAIGEAFAAVLIVAGGAVLVGLATLV